MLAFKRNYRQLTILIAHSKLILWYILWFCERTVLTVVKSILSNNFHRRGNWGRTEDGKILISLVFSTTSTFSAVVSDFKTVDTFLSQTLNHKIRWICNTWSVVCGKSKKDEKCMGNRWERERGKGKCITKWYREKERKEKEKWEGEGEGRV